MSSSCMYALIYETKNFSKRKLKQKKFKDGWIESSGKPFIEPVLTFLAKNHCILMLVVASLDCQLLFYSLLYIYFNIKGNWMWTMKDAADSFKKYCVWCPERDRSGIIIRYCFIYSQLEWKEEISCYWLSFNEARRI